MFARFAGGISELLIRRISGSAVTTVYAKELVARNIRGHRLTQNIQVLFSLVYKPYFRRDAGILLDVRGFPAKIRHPGRNF
jgi:hypothetical protein